MANENEALRVKLAQEFQTAWAAGGEPFPVEYQNTAQTGEQDGTWGRFSILNGDRKATTIGATHRRMTGLVALQVFIPREGGTRDGSLAFDTLASAFDFTQLVLTLDDDTTAYIVFRATYEAGGTVGDPDSKAHHQRTFYCPFYYDTAPE